MGEQGRRHRQLRIADVRSHTAFSMFTDFGNWSVFKPADIHLPNLTAIFAQLEAWAEAPKGVRKARRDV
jgi:hypothetical protein